MADFSRDLGRGNNPWGEWPQQRQIWICRYGPGVEQPELAEKRAVVVVSRKRKRKLDLVTVVPLFKSKTGTPVRISLPPCPSKRFIREEMWARPDLVTSVSRRRLQRVSLRDEQGDIMGTFGASVAYSDWIALQTAMSRWLALSYLTMGNE
ncbi:MAG: hypothetical protein FD124_112 [Alphaproteobacteria bacterium]|nr:MAG: hypothetical protein FD124_112 [Alphaproteobacteria bacterium]